jgi:hypothetical protein
MANQLFTEVKVLENILTSPLTFEEIKEQKDENNRISATLKFTLDEIMGNSRDCFLNLISDRITKNHYLMDIEYELVGISGGCIVIKATGDVSAILVLKGEE